MSTEAITDEIHMITWLFLQIKNTILIYICMNIDYAKEMQTYHLVWWA